MGGPLDPAPSPVVASPVIQARAMPTAPTVATFRFAYANSEAAFAAELRVPADTWAAVALVLGVVAVAALIAFTAT